MFFCEGLKNCQVEERRGITRNRRETKAEREKKLFDEIRKGDESCFEVGKTVKDFCYGKHSHRMTKNKF